MPPVSMTVIDAVLLLLIYLYTHGIFALGIYKNTKMEHPLIVTYCKCAINALTKSIDLVPDIANRPCHNRLSYGNGIIDPSCRVFAGIPKYFCRRNRNYG